MSSTAKATTYAQRLGEQLVLKPTVLKCLTEIISGSVRIG